MRKGVGREREKERENINARQGRQTDSGTAGAGGGAYLLISLRCVASRFVRFVLFSIAFCGPNLHA